MIGILCMVRELVDLVDLCPYGPSFRPCVQPETSTLQVQGLCRIESVPYPVVESPELPRTVDPQHSLVVAPRVALFSAVPFEVEDISTLDDTARDQDQQLRLTSGGRIWRRGFFEVSEEVEALSKDCGEVAQRLESDDKTLQMFGTNLESECYLQGFTLLRSFRFRGRRCKRCGGSVFGG
ncbi:unnamed protein product [Mytilus coruscus]|uniref:Uncharacterized protein n=1 Tax=Mytilus coruscus TaxID=42192 RepID=A0A6J8DH48_MYTCO|nr:unnamed protein product [Mytilus coruscus]